MVFDRWGRGQQVEPEFTFEAFLDDFHVQKAQEAYAEAESQCVRGFGLPHQSRVVERKFLECFFERFVLIAFDGEEASEYHGLYVAVARKRFGCAICLVGDRVADLDLRNILQARDEIADVADRKIGKCNLGRFAGADFLYEGFCSSCHHVNLVALFNRTVDYANECDDSAVSVEIRIEDEGAQGCVCIADRGRNVVDNGFEKVVHAFAGFCRAQNGIVCWNRQSILDLLAGTVGVGCREIDLVDQGDDFKIRVHCHHGVGNRLRLDTLRSIYDENGAFACRQGTRDLVGKVDMTRCIDEVELVRFTVVCRVVDAHSLAFDRDAALALDVHRIEQLFLHIAC